MTEVQTLKKNAKAIADFLDFLKYKKMAKNTIVNYETNLRQLYQYCELHGLLILELKAEDIISFFQLEMEHLKNSSHNAKLSTLRSFYEYHKMIGSVREVPVYKYMYSKPEYKELPAMNDEHYLIFYDYMLNHTSLEYLVCMELLYTSGLRISEAENLDINKDLYQVSDRLVLNLKGKGARQRQVPIYSDFLNETLKAYRENIKTNIPVKLATNRQTLQYHMDNCIRENIDLPKYTTHSFRRGFAFNAMTHFKDIELVRRLMGHDSYNTTLVYLSKTKIDLVKTLNNPLPAPDFQSMTRAPKSTAT